jgi:hypothetical protein
MEKGPITTSRISAAEIGLYDGIGKDQRSSAIGARTARVTGQPGDRVTLSPAALQHQATSRLTTTPLDATERQVADVLEQAYSELYERAGKSDYMASIADTSDRSADATAGRILDGITGYIYKAYQMGHPDMTAERFDAFQTQVLEGFSQGLSEAKGMISVAGLLDPEMTLDIGKTEDLVHRGLEDFFAREKERLFGNPKPELLTA